MKALLKNQSGFSLVEILVSMGLLGISAQAAMGILQMQSKSTNQVKYMMGVQYIYEDISMRLKKEGVCNATFNGLNINNGSSIDSIVDGGELYAAGTNFDDGKLEIHRYTLSDVERPSSGAEGLGSAVLNIHFRINSENIAPAMRRAKRSLPITLAFNNAGSVLGCFTDLDGAIRKGKQEMCESIGGIYENGACEKMAMKVAMSDEQCTSSNAGSLRYNQGQSIVELCHNSNWQSISERTENPTCPDPEPVQVIASTTTTQEPIELAPPPEDFDNTFYIQEYDPNANN